MSSDINVETIMDGARHLLIDACKTANDTGQEYVVVGGWCPYLRNRSVFPHPGTLDVDLLFFGGDMQGQLGKVFKRFIEKGYLISAKNDFQLLREITVNSKPVIFNVDFLHPEETVLKKNSIYVDHFDLGIRYDNAPDREKKNKSIALPSSRFILEHKLYDNFSLEDGVEIPLINEAGLIFTKCKSVQMAKRYRDAFDIFISLAQKDGNNQYVVDAIKESCAAEIGGRELQKAIKDLKEFCTHKDTKDIFDNNVRKFANIRSVPSPRDFVLEQLRTIETVE